MSELSLIVLIQGIMCFCIVVLTVSLLRLSQEFHQIFQRVRTMLPECDQTIQEAQKTISTLHQIVERVDLLMEECARVLSVARHTTEGAVDSVKRLREGLFSRGSQNGTKRKSRQTRGRAKERRRKET